MNWISLATAIFVSLVSAGIGYGISQWRNRVRYWVGILTFGTRTEPSEVMQDLRILRDLEWQSWCVDGLPRQLLLGNVMEIAERATYLLDSTRNTVSELQRAMDQLTTSDNPIKSTAIMHSLFLDDGMENLANAVNLAAIAIPEPPRDMKEHLAIFPRKDSNGSLLVTIDFPVRMVDLRASNEPLQTKLLSVARLISSLDATCIRPLFASFQELISTQRDMAHRLKAELQPIIDRRSRFACEFSVTNFGATPFVLSAENVRVFVRRDSSEAVQECALLLSEAETGKLVPAPTITVIEAGKSGIYIASTVKAIEEIDEGQELIGAFNKGNRKARVSVDLMGREFSKFRSITSDDVGFKAGSTQRL